MKTREIYSILLKIIGLISLWYAINAILMAMFSGFGAIASSFAPVPVGNLLFLTMLVFILKTIIPLFIAFYCLFHTEIVLRLFKLDDDSTPALLTSRKVIYHMLVLSFGVYLFANGANNFLSVDYTTDTKTEMSQVVNKLGDISDVVSKVYSKKVNINIFGLLEMLIGVLLLFKSKSISERLQANFYNESK